MRLIWKKVVDMSRPPSRHAKFFKKSPMYNPSYVLTAHRQMLPPPPLLTACRNAPSPSAATSTGSSMT